MDSAISLVIVLLILIGLFVLGGESRKDRSDSKNIPYAKPEHRGKQ